MSCEICTLLNEAKCLQVNQYYKIVQKGKFYYAIWHECVTWGGVRTCKRKIHDMKHETQQFLRQMFKPDFVGMDVVEQPHLHFKCWRIKKVNG